jgi:hypothetical protein
MSGGCLDYQSRVELENHGVSGLRWSEFPDRFDLIKTNSQKEDESEDAGILRLGIESSAK